MNIVMLFHAISCYVMLCYVMLCYVMLCYVMLCYVMLCYEFSIGKTPFVPVLKYSPNSLTTLITVNLTRILLGYMYVKNEINKISIYYKLAKGMDKEMFWFTNFYIFDNF